MTGASGKFQQPYFPGGFFQQGRSGQVAKLEFTITLSGQSSATTAIITAYLSTGSGTSVGFPGSVLVASPSLTVTNFASSVWHGEVLISNFGSGYGVSSVSTNLQSTIDIRYFNAVATSGVLVAGPTALQTIDFSVNQWVQLGVTFNTSSTSNSATLQQAILYGLNLPGIASITSHFSFDVAIIEIWLYVRNLSVIDLSAVKVTALLTLPGGLTELLR